MLVLIVLVLVCLAVGFVGSQFSPGPWYAQLTKPSWTPPSSVFGPVWTVLYILMGLAAWLVWRKAGLAEARAAFVCFGIQLVLNALWSPLFFGMHRPGLALVDIALLWLVIVVTLVLFWHVRAWAGVLLVPYLVWVSYATALNFSLWRLNS